MRQVRVLFICVLAGCSGKVSGPQGLAGAGGGFAGASGAAGVIAGSGGAGAAGMAGAAGAAAVGGGSSAGRGAAGRAGVGGAGSGGTGGRSGTGGVAGAPPALCSSPLAAADVAANATATIGSGTAASCTEAALRTAVMVGGVVRFNCGDAPATIKITQTLIAPGNKDTTIDGEDRIVLDGGGTTQILRTSNSNFRTNDRILRVQRLTMTGGRDMGTGFKARDGDKTCAWGYKQGGGGAIYSRDVNIHVLGVTFRDNHGPELGPDVAGGAIYSTGSKKLIVANSTFTGNSAANGGAIGTLHTSSELYNVVFENNRATGLLANFADATGCPTFNHEEQGGAGGLGGAFYADGQDPGDTFCGVRMSDNESGDLGGAVFRSAYWGLISNSPKQEFSWDQTTLERNKSGKGGGAGYLNNALFTVKRSHFIGNESGDDGGALKLTGLTLRADDLDFMNNKARTAGGAVAHWEVGPEGAGSSSNIRFSNNKPNDTAGDYPK